MIIAVVGSRSFNNYELLSSELKKHAITQIVSGGAKGADLLAKKYAIDHGIPIKEHLPDYNQFGRSAPIIRNRLIVDDAEMVIAFWDGASKGTRYTIDYAAKQNKRILIINI